MQKATAWAASELPTELSLDELKQSLATIKEEGERAAQVGLQLGGDRVKVVEQRDDAGGDEREGEREQREAARHRREVGGCVGGGAVEGGEAEAELVVVVERAEAAGGAHRGPRCPSPSARRSWR